MNGWPPAVLLAMRQDVMRQILRDLFRGCGVRNLELCPSCEDALAILWSLAKQWDVLVLDAGLANALETVRQVRASASFRLKVVLIFSAPTQEEIRAAKAAGADDLIIYPVSQAMLEDKLRKLVNVGAVVR